MRVKILETQERLGIKKGEIYSAKRYQYDPEKMELIQREPDGYDPSCNQYCHELAYWINNQWMVIRNNQYIPEHLGE